jgi:hypothetical protein
MEFPPSIPDLVVHGATSAGIAAAVQARREGLSVRLIGADALAGGMSVCGLGWTDIGNKGAIGGLAREFYCDLGAYYGSKDLCWALEPGAAQAVFGEWLTRAGIEPELGARLKRADCQEGRICSLVMEDGREFAARYFIDASYEGDVLAAAGASHRIGRESIEEFDEIYNGRHFGHPGHNFSMFVDPYRVPGRPSSGILPGLSDEAPGKQGDGDSCVQAYNFRLCLTKEPSLKVPFPQPGNYDPLRYELLGRYLDTGVWDVLQLTRPVGSGAKTDTNNFGAFSTDHIGANHDYPGADWTRRDAIFRDHLAYTQGLLWFLAHDPRVPEAIRAEVSAWGLAGDEFTSWGHFPPQFYVREARRLIGKYVTTEHDCVGARSVDDAVALAAYQIDSHNCRRIVMGGRAFNEGNVEIKILRPYPISYRCLTPRRPECRNLLVSCAISATHTAFGSIRMEPVFMALGQSAAAAVALAQTGNQDVQDVDIYRLQERLTEGGQRLRWPCGEDQPVGHPALRS